MKLKRTTSGLLAGVMTLTTIFSSFAAEAKSINSIPTALETGIVEESVATGVSGDYEYDFLNDGTIEITWYSGDETELVIPSEIDGYKVTSIGDFAFEYCAGFTLISIPDSITSIGNYAFAGCYNLASIIMPNSVISIGDFAFVGCSNLTSIIIPNSVTSIGEFAFCNCSSLTSIIIPGSVTSISESIFAGCFGLTYITINDSVTSIGYDAFYQCFDLTDVYYTGTQEQWNEIDINIDDYGNDALLNATIHYHGEYTIKNEIEPTCTEEGSCEKVYYCEICDEELGRETVTIDALGHDWGEWGIISEATETEPGERQHTCKRCGEIEKKITRLREIPVDQSKVLYGELEGDGNLRIEIYNYYGDTGNPEVSPIVPANIIDAYSVSVTFTITGLNDLLDTVDYSAAMIFADKSWYAMDMRNTIIPIIISDGTYTITSNFEPWVDEDTGDPFLPIANGVTCLVVEIIGLADDLSNSDFSKFIISDVKVVIETSYDGEFVGNDHESEYISHAHIASETVRENGYDATCTGYGSYYLITRCELCDKIIRRKTVTKPALGHDWGEWNIISEATETESGERQHICKRCDKIEKIITPPTSLETTEVPLDNAGMTVDDGGLRVNIVHPWASSDDWDTFNIIDSVKFEGTQTISFKFTVEGYEEYGKPFNAWLIFATNTWDDESNLYYWGAGDSFGVHQTPVAIRGNGEYVITLTTDRPIVVEDNFFIALQTDIIPDYDEKYELINIPQLSLAQAARDGALIADSQSNILIGDVNNDGAVDPLDNIALAMWLAGWEGDINEAAADINGDGTIDPLDNVELAMKLAGWDG
ncbi:MAG: leucine-rich repeat protein [Eubacterium sp.]|nr:leucine-rich repeat protein [Eubacterium sp.]